MATPDAAAAAAAAQARDALNKAAFSASIFKRGQKAELFEDGQPLDEAAELAGKLDELHAVWSMERTGKDLAAAIWRPELGVAEVVLQRGRLLAHMGFTKGRKLYLFIEEVVFLVDRANLLLFLDGGGGQGQRLLSLQEATDLMAACGVPLDCYLVFAKLLRAGYIVTRHPARWALGPGDDPAGVAAAAGAWGRAPADAAAAEQQERQQGGAAPPAQQARGPPAAVPAGPPRKKRRAEGQQQRSGKWWVGEPAAAATEAGADAGADGAAQQQGPGSSEPAPLGGSAEGPGTAAAGNPWLAGMPPGFLASLPRCAVLPTPAQRAAVDFPRMAPLPAIPLGELRLPGGAAAGRSLLHFNVFASNARFSRKQPGQPVYAVAVLPCSQPPTPEIMAAADAAAGGVPVRFSTVEKGDICFYGAAHVELRSILM